jgi:hypothetical protein
MRHLIPVVRILLGLVCWLFAYLVAVLVGLPLTWQVITVAVAYCAATLASECVVAGFKAIESPAPAPDEVRS